MVDESRQFELPSRDAAERELLEVTRDYVRFLEDKAPHVDSTGSFIFYESMGRKALDLLTDSELHFRERLAARREAALNASE